MIELNDILKLPRFNDLKLLTDPQTIVNKLVASVEITETPDVEFFISNDVIVLSTAMYFENQQELLIPFIDSLIRAKSPALAIKTDRFLNGKIIPEVINYANNVNFPLIDIPDRYQLGDLMRQFSNIIMDNKQEEITFALDIQKQFSALLLNDASIDQLITEFSFIFKNPVILLDPFHQLIAQSSYFQRAKIDVRGIVAQVAPFSDKNLPNNSYHLIQINNKKLQISVNQISLFKYFSYYLLILNPETIPYPISDFALEQASLIISYQLYKQFKLNEADSDNKSHYILNAIIDSNGKVSQLFKNSDHADVILSQFYQFIEVHEEEAIHHKTKSVFLQEKNKLIYNWLIQHKDKYFQNAVILRRESNDNPLILIQHPLDNLDEVLEEIRQFISQTMPINLLFSISEPIYHHDDLKLALTQARLSFEERLQDKDLSPIKYFNHLGLAHLFQKVPSQDIIYFCKSILKELAFPNSEGLIDLRNTLTVYLENQCETTTTANQLIIHRNTVKYRIKKCEEILMRPVNNPKFSLELRVALAISSLVSEGHTS